MGNLEFFRTLAIAVLVSAGCKHSPEGKSQVATFDRGGSFEGLNKRSGCFATALQSSRILEAISGKGSSEIGLHNEVPPVKHVSNTAETCSEDYIAEMIGTFLGKPETRVSFRMNCIEKDKTNSRISSVTLRTAGMVLPVTMYPRELRYWKQLGVIVEC